MSDSILSPATLVDIPALFSAQKANALAISKTTAKERIAKLKKILAYTAAHEEEIKQALLSDMKRHPSETMIGEVMGVNGEVKHLIKHLKGWMKPQKLPTPMGMIGTSAYVRYEAKGVCLIISPWNYPFNLSIKPLAQAIAAGNTAILKPSEMTPATSALLRTMIAELFEPNEVAVVEGDVAASTELLSLPFNHIFFTGSPNVGKVVMKAAAEHLASVTLELGGKSPCIIDETADVKKTAEKLAWGKFFNNGQTCIAPDYVLVHKSLGKELVDELEKATQTMYNSGGKGVEASPDYCRIVNRRHFLRVKGLIDDAVAKGATVNFGNATNEDDNFIAPTVLTGVNDSMTVMQQEIFGPVLPIVEFSDNQEVIDKINEGEKPLALYINSRNNENIKYFIDNTSAGGTVINEMLIHYGHVEMPFGGVNNSGIGKSGGIFGFTEFSNQRGVLRQNFGTLKFLYPPYTETVNKLVRFFVKFL